MCAGRYENKRSEAIIVTKKWKHRVKWTKYINERVIATSIAVNKQQITLLSVYMPHSDYADHHVEKTGTLWKWNSVIRSPEGALQPSRRDSADRQRVRRVSDKKRHEARFDTIFLICLGE